MKSFYTSGKFWAVLLLSLILCGTAAAGEVAPRPAAAITAQPTAFLQKFVNEESKVNHENLQHNPELLNALLSNELTLDQIEIDKLRKIYDDPLLHFALVCGTNSCPRLSRTAYVGKNLFAQLKNQAQFALLGPRYVKVDDARKIVRLPKIFQWYESDFSTSGKTRVMYRNQFRKNGRIPTWYPLEYYPYNWTLNNRN